MSKPENSFIAGVHKYIGCYAEKMHNPYRGGTPDVWYSGLLRDLWVEYKFIVLPKRDTTVIVPDLSPLQLQWLRLRANEGRNVAVAVGCKEGGAILEKHQWEALTAHEFRRILISRRALADRITGFANFAVPLHQTAFKTNA